MSSSKKVKKETKKEKEEKLKREKLLSKLALIESLKKCPKDARCRLINYLNPQGLAVLSETIKNCIRKDAPLKDSQKKRFLKEYAKEKKVLLELTKKRGTFKNKKKLLMKQHGGFLGTLLGIKYFSSSAAVEKKDDGAHFFFTLVKIVIF
jgi:hypothetical protein